jgi:diacylglycerol kinase family enzyme
VLRKLPKLYRGTLRGDPLLLECASAFVRIETDVDSAVQADGQIVGRTPVDVRVQPQALRVVHNAAMRT